MNPNAIVLWLLCGGIGYLANDVKGAVFGVVVGLGISLLAAFIPDRRRRW